jgi:hypothetical protein
VSLAISFSLHSLLFFALLETATLTLTPTPTPTLFLSTRSEADKETIESEHAIAVANNATKDTALATAQAEIADLKNQVRVVIMITVRHTPPYITIITIHHHTSPYAS